MTSRSLRRQQGAAAVEFALVSILAILLVFGVIELGRALFKWNSGVDAARRGARAAAIVPMNDKASIVAEMRLVFPELQEDDVLLEYSPDGAFPASGCEPDTCRFVRVGISYTFRPLVFFLPPLKMPPFSTTYPVEALGNYGPISP